MPSKPLKYLKKHDCYLITLQAQTKRQPGLYDVKREAGSATPRGYVERTGGIFVAHLYHPAHSCDMTRSFLVAVFTTMDEAVQAVLDTPLQLRASDYK